MTLKLGDVKAIATGKRDITDSLPLLELLERHLLATGAMLVCEVEDHCILVIDSSTEIGSGVKLFASQQSKCRLPEGNIQWSRVSMLLSDQNAAKLILRIREVLND